jgi:hypothetical protein
MEACEQVVERERQIGAPRAEVDDAQRPRGQRRDDVLDELHEAVDLPELRPSLRAHTALCGLDAESHEIGHRLSLR